MLAGIAGPWPHTWAPATGGRDSGGPHERGDRALEHLRLES